MNKFRDSLHQPQKSQKSDEIFVLNMLKDDIRQNFCLQVFSLFDNVQKMSFKCVELYLAHKNIPMTN